MKLLKRKISFLVFASLHTLGAYAADCRFATVGSPHSNCFDLAAAAGITVAQLTSFNPGLNCNLLQLGQRLCISTGTLPGIPKPNPDGSCASYKIKSGDYCAAIAAANYITVAQLESFNTKTYKWKGCANLAVGLTICLSTGTPPPIPINPLLDCGPETQGNKTCPLNACCSAFGYCGLTSEFCTNAPNGDPCLSNCGITPLPSCGGSQLTRKIGYYASWASRRKCQPFGPENLDLNGYTHVIYAFVNISPLLELSMTAPDEAILKGLVARKSDFPNVKILFAVGGWAFSTEDATKTIFTTMVSTAASRTKFVAAVKQFLVRYKLDGIDIDFEYPSAMERNAPPSETADLTVFFQELRSTLPSTAIISIAAPAGYWFLKGFEINKLQNYVTFINMMSYDYHGPWDQNVQENGTAKPHTSAQDIEDSIRLYKRAGIDLGKVNLGLAWYGRTFAVGSCTGLGCRMSGGGSPGPCTGESGTLSQLEVKDKAKGITPNYNSTSMTYSFNRDGDFITFDDTTSWTAKTNLAKTRCFGGTFVWSLDQGTPTIPATPTTTVTAVPTVTQTVSVRCETISSTVRADCQRMVTDIFDTYNLNTNKCSTNIGVKTFCYKSCCIYLTMDDWRDRNIRAKEIKAAAQKILDSCGGNSLALRDEKALSKRMGAIPVAAIILSWNIIAVLGVVEVIIGAVVTALVAGLKELFDDEDERGDFIMKTVTDAQKAHPEWNVVGIHPDHEKNFEEPWHHEHVEYDRRDPLGTFGYEIYYFRRGTIRNKGDGGYVNWAFYGLWEKINGDDKNIKFFAPGKRYGVIGPIKATYTHQGKNYDIDTGVCLGDDAGCGTCFLDP